MSWSFVQNTNNNNGSSPITATFTNTPAQGNLILVSIGVNSPAGLTSVTDGTHNFDALASNTSSTGKGSYIYGYIAGASQSKNVVVTQSGKVLYVNIYELSGNFAATIGTPSSYIDNSQVSQTTFGTGSPSTSMTLTATNTNSLAFANIYMASTVTGVGWSASSGSMTTEQAIASGAIQFFDGYETGIGTTAYSTQATWTTSRAWCECMVLLLPAAVPLTLGVSDTEGAATETIKLLVSSNRLVSDTTTTSESVTMEVDAYPRASDTTMTSENIGLNVNSFPNLSDATTTSESVQLEMDAYINVSDSTTTSESVTVTIPAPSQSNISVSDTTTTSENVVMDYDDSLSLSDTTVTSENLGYYAELIATREQLFIVLVDLVNKSDNTTTSELVTFGIDENINISDNTSISENVSVLLGALFVPVSDSTTTSESTSIFQPSLAINISDPTVTSENMTITNNSVRFIMVADSTTTSELVGLIVYQAPKDMNFSIGKTGTITVSVARKINPTFKMKVGAL